VREHRLQSALARRLLQEACQESGFELPTATYQVPALKLFDTLASNFAVEASISHCPKLIAVALSGGRVGVDCESHRPGRNWQGIADAYFTEEEAESLRASPVSKAEEQFLRYWTMKEAFVKATRGNLWTDLNTLSFRGSQVITNITPITGKWNFWHTTVDDIVVSACSEGIEDPYFQVNWCENP